MSLHVAALTTPPLSRLCLYSTFVSQVFTSQDFEINISDHKWHHWKSYQLQSCSSIRDLPLWCLLFRSSSEVIWQIWILNHQNFSYTFRTSNDLKWKSHQLQCFSSHRDLQLWFWSIFHPRSFENFEFQNFRTLDTNFIP